MYVYLSRYQVYFFYFGFVSVAGQVFKFFNYFCVFQCCYCFEVLFVIFKEIIGQDQVQYGVGGFKFFEIKVLVYCNIRKGNGVRFIKGINEFFYYLIVIGNIFVSFFKVFFVFVFQYFINFV